ncbi:MAG: hypothetical protein KAV00_00195 [Phycisphaerae bacterium]|nr:hypothetical protein [Phycisphaerae bacterium]
MIRENNKRVITIIGAASTTFGPKVLRDIINHPGLGGSTFRFVDINEERLETYTRLAGKIAERIDHDVRIESTPDRKQALKGADYVIISVDTGHYDTWKQDFDVPVKHGIRQVMGELAGPGGLFHSLRQIPLHLEFARDIESICPDAMVMICSNPLNRICLALHRHSNVGQIVGLCHGVEMSVYLFLQHHIGIPGDDIETTAAGLNHMTWILEICRRSTGEDLYPLIREKLSGLDPQHQPLSRKFLDVFGCFPAVMDNHVGEYLPYAHEFVGLAGLDFASHLDQEHKRWKYLQALSRDEAMWDDYEKQYGDQSALSEELRLDHLFAPRNWTDTLAFPLINAVENNARIRMPAINMLNRGTINNLPDDIFVEAPAIVDAFGVTPLRIGALPGPLAALNRRDADQMELTVAAAVSGNRNLILQAMMLDPVVDSVSAAEQIIDEMMAAQKQYLPAFA